MAIPVSHRHHLNTQQTSENKIDMTQQASMNKLPEGNTKYYVCIIVKLVRKTIFSLGFAIHYFSTYFPGVPSNLQL